MASKVYFMSDRASHGGESTPFKAVKLLRAGTWRVYEVAEQTGFGDYKNFCQVFRRYLDTTPSAIIQESIGKNI